MNIFIYEHYDRSIGGNQRYIMLLMERTKAIYGDNFKITLALRGKGVFYKAIKDTCQVLTLDRKGLFGRWFALWQLLRKLRPDVIVCNNEASLLTVLPAAVALRLKIIWQVKNLRRSNWSDLTCFTFARRVLAIAPQSIRIKHKRLAGYFAKKIFIQPIGTQLRDFLLLPAPLEGQGPMRILAITYISREKGTDVLIKALEILDAQGLHARVRVVGLTPSGYERLESELKERAMKLNGIRVEWLGWRGDIPKLLEWCQILVHPSRNDGSSRSVVEAMASGRPVVASNVGGVPELFADGREGFLVPAGDYDALANRIKRLDGDADLRGKMGASGRFRAKENFDIDHHIARLKDHVYAVVGAG